MRGRLLAGLLVLAALGGGCLSDDEAGAPPAPTTPSTPTATAPPEGRELRLLAPAGRYPPALLQRFERTARCDVRFTAAGSGARAVELLRAEPDGYDLVALPLHELLPLVRGRLAAPIDPDAVPALRDLAPPFRQLEGAGSGNASYAVAVTWSASLLLSVHGPLGSPEEPPSARVLFEPRARGAVAVADTPLALAAASLYLGFDPPFALSPDQLHAAARLLELQRPLVFRYATTTADLRHVLEAGEARLAWGPASVADGSGGRVRATVPSEGAVGEVDVLAHAAAAPDARCAARFLRFVLTRRAQVALARAAGAAPVLPSACRVVRGRLCALLAADQRLERVRLASSPTTPDGASAWPAWTAAWREVTRP